MSKYELYDSLVEPPPHCQCEGCYLYGCPGDNSVPCPKGEQIANQWKEYYKRRRALREEQLRIEREKRVISPAELKAKEREPSSSRYDDAVIYTLLAVLYLGFLCRNAFTRGI